MIATHTNRSSRRTKSRRPPLLIVSIPDELEDFIWDLLIPHIENPANVIGEIRDQLGERHRARPVVVGEHCPKCCLKEFSGRIDKSWWIEFRFRYVRVGNVLHVTRAWIDPRKTSRCELDPAD